MYFLLVRVGDGTKSKMPSLTRGIKDISADFKSNPIIAGFQIFFSTLFYGPAITVNNNIYQKFGLNNKNLIIYSVYCRIIF